ncbi:glycine betaine ABC transporter substrate-binding protein [Pseudonocardia sp. KRD291]|uniref:glycine betaine ABC transporter substrate-binding protein n=1 Tax=Pseudonocardia sp. KRD291 TaxID=2792007 RepID=UPI001C4A42BE|nr:glycine betaine ABC transporter substrate-binding protein [Pseudonocardia sp. KRD291]MBW0104349.1 glycine/betaine ABC transporter substrate-binding protein [Pseudonocardia sp. KRD291]
MQPSGRPAEPDPHDRRPAIIAVAVALLVVAVVLTLVFVRDSTGRDGDAPGLSTLADLSGQTYVVGGKNISEEQSILCEITVAALQEARATVTGRCDTGSTEVTRRALLDGGIDLYWEYTGTAWEVFLGQSQDIPDPARLHDLVAQQDLRLNGVVWTDRADVNDTYAFAMADDRATGTGITSLSAMAAHVGSGAPGDVCVEREYATRPDGLANMARAYGFTIPPDRLRVLAAGDIYQATARGECLFGEVYSTDGRIPGLDLRVLDDDKSYHSVYNPAPTIRQDVYDRDPDVARVLDPIAGALDYPTMVALNGEVSAQGRDPREVARTWLAEKGFAPSR